MTVKQYGLSAVGSDVELGKRGPRLQRNGNGLSVLHNDGSLASIKVAGAINADEPVTLSQLESKTVEDFGSTAYGKGLLENTDALATRNYLGLGTAAVASVGTGLGEVPSVDASGTINVNALTSSKWNATVDINLTGMVSGTASIDGSGNVDITTTINEIPEGQNSSYTVITSTTGLTVNNKYYITASNITLTLPSTTSVNVGDVIIVRSQYSISSTLAVYDQVNEQILTDAGATSTLLIDIMQENSLVYAGSGTWEML